MSNQCTTVISIYHIIYQNIIQYQYIFDIFMLVMVGTVGITAHLYDDNCMFVDVDNIYDTRYAEI